MPYTLQHAAAEIEGAISAVTADTTGANAATELTSPAGTEYLPVWDAGSPKFITTANILAYTNQALDDVTDVTITSQALGDTLYASSGSAWVNLAGNTTTTKKFFSQTGDGAASAAPSWAALATSDIPDLSGTYATLSGGNSLTGDQTLTDAEFAMAKGTELTTSATSGFVHLPTCAGVPSGTPGTTHTGAAPIIVDRTNARVYAYYGAAWNNLSVVGGGANALNDLTDVTLTATATNDYLRYNGSIFVNTALDISTDTSPALGGTLAAGTNPITFGDNGRVQWESTPTSSGNYSGETALFTAGTAISQFEAVYIATDGDLELADASAASTAPCIGIAVAAISNTASGVILMRGFIKNVGWTFTIGDDIYLSTTAGALVASATALAYSTSGEILQVIGTATAADTVYINPSNDYATI